VAVAAQQPSPAALNPAWAPIVTIGLSMERGRPTFGGVFISPILAAARALKFYKILRCTLMTGARV